MNYPKQVSWQSRLMATLLDGILVGLLAGTLNGLFKLVSGPNFGQVVYSLGSFVAIFIGTTMDLALVFFPYEILGIIICFLTEIFGFFISVIIAILIFSSSMSGMYQNLFICSFPPLFISCVYHGLMESSHQQSTFGMRSFGLITVDTNQNRISFTRAVKRYLLRPFFLYNNSCMIIAKPDSNKRRQTADSLETTSYIKHPSWYSRLIAAILDAIVVTYLGNTLTFPFMCAAASGADMAGIVIIGLLLIYSTIIYFCTAICGLLVLLVIPIVGWFCLCQIHDPTMKQAIVNPNFLYWVGIMNGLPLCFALCFAAFYQILMESSSKQATFGKSIMALIVVDKAGRKISFSRALARYFFKELSLILLGLPQLMLVFASDQTLYDKASGCVVTNKPKEREVTSFE